jgi:hypothetical protein
VVILPNVRAHDRAKIEGAYGGDLIKVRGSDKWLGGEIRSLGSDKPAAVIIPETPDRARAESQSRGSQLSGWQKPTCARMWRPLASPASAED